MKAIVTSVILLLLTATVPAFSQMSDMSMKERGMGHGPTMHMGPMDKMGDMSGMCLEHAEKMGFSDDQLVKMKTIHSEMQKKQARFKADVKIAEIELMEILDEKDFNLEKASAAVGKIEGIKTAHHQEMLKAMKEVRTLLTDEQFKKMKKMMSMKAGDNSED